MKNNPFNVTILSLFEEIALSYFEHSILKRAQQNKLWSLRTVNIRDFGQGKHKKVDDEVFGGGSGLLLRADVLGLAIDHALKQGASKNLIFVTPSGRLFDQKMAKQFAKTDGLTILCGRFEGVDQRVIDTFNIQEVSIGDYILTNGDIAACVLVDSTLRLLPNVLNSPASLSEESFNNFLLEYPQYTRPVMWRGFEVPRLLRLGNHSKIAAWRFGKAVRKTRRVRPDLWQLYKNFIKGNGNG